MIFQENWSWNKAVLVSDLRNGCMVTNNTDGLYTLVARSILYLPVTLAHVKDQFVTSGRGLHVNANSRSSGWHLAGARFPDSRT